MCSVLSVRDNSALQSNLNSFSFEWFQHEFWNIIESSDRYVCVYKGTVDTEQKSCFPTNKGNPYSRFVLINFELNLNFYQPSGPWSRRLSPVSVVLSGWESLITPGRDTNPTQVSSQQTLVLIYLTRKDRKLSLLRRKRRSHKYSFSLLN